MSNVIDHTNETHIVDRVNDNNANFCCYNATGVKSNTNSIHLDDNSHVVDNNNNNIHNVDCVNDNNANFCCYNAASVKSNTNSIYPDDNSHAVDNNHNRTTSHDVYIDSDAVGIESVVDYHAVDVVHDYTTNSSAYNAIETDSGTSSFNDNNVVPQCHMCMPNSSLLAHQATSHK
ncbi:probable basic-leucine zipper transcription factor S [Pistacia vera]|uniref:probable basic-leucine zipper transcription factor S n=1 Tax=Pistacia vera TaxID=55513 RepID=UPI00126347FF|nr:probable basic-leucine zipper transcription factor S [Pistacia vera]